MFTIKRYSIDNHGDVFNHILLDTEPSGYLASLGRLFREEFVIEKTWIGKTDRKKSTFKITRTKFGFLKTGISAIKICGQLTQDESRIDIRIKPMTLSVINLIWATSFFGFLIASFFNDWVWWTVLGGFVIIQILLFILDYRATEEKFTDYVNSLRSNALQQTV